jgi:transposase InsO family protein
MVSRARREQPNGFANEELRICLAENLSSAGEGDPRSSPATQRTLRNYRANAHAPARITLFVRAMQRCRRNAGGHGSRISLEIRHDRVYEPHELGDKGIRPRFLVRDRDSKFVRDFDEVFRSEGIRVIKAPVRAPKARAHAERWVGSVRRECLDRLLIVGRRHLEHVVREYAQHYNTHRPHRSLDQRTPLAKPPINEPAPRPELPQLDLLRRRDRLGGLLREYRIAA